jgi:hypothetical protein
MCVLRDSGSGRWGDGQPTLHIKVLTRDSGSGRWGDGQPTMDKHHSTLKYLPEKEKAVINLAKRKRPRLRKRDKPLESNLPT